MEFAWNHPWDVTPREARDLQLEASRRVVIHDAAAFVYPTLPAELVAVDVGYDRATDRCFAALIRWDVKHGRALEELSLVQPSTFPYVPGYLSFREIPALLPLFAQLRNTPELVLCDGQGIAHPRRIGLASHLGVILDCPTLGWAKSRLIGSFAEPAMDQGSATPLRDHDETIGWAFRSRARCRPTFVSPGHRLSLETALALARALAGPHRLSPPARRAHQLTRLGQQQAAENH